MSEANVQVPEGAKQVDQSDGDAAARLVTEVTQGMGGRSTTGEPEASANKSTNSAKSDNSDERYIKDEELSKRVLAAREAIGSRRVFAETVSMTQSAIWRGEHNKVHPDEVPLFNAALAVVEPRIAKGEWAKSSDPASSKLTMTLEAINEALTFLDQLDKLVKAKTQRDFLTQAVKVLLDARK